MNNKEKEVKEGFMSKDELISLLKENIIQSILAYASDNLKDDKDVILEACKNSVENLIYASDRLRNDKELILEAMKQNPLALIHASKELQDNIELLEIMEISKLPNLNIFEKNWYQERLNYLNNIRNNEDKNYMERGIKVSKLNNKKNKY